MRPQPVILFERFYSLSLAISALTVALYWNEMGVLGPQARMLALVIAAVTLALFLALVLLVSRRRSLAAAWVLGALTLLTAGAWIYSIWRTPAGVMFDWAGLIQHLLELAAIALLLTAPARAWLTGTRTGNDDAA